MGEHTLKYTAPPTVAKFMRSDAFFRGIQGPVGCTSADTEFLTPAGWKRMDEYISGDLVAQWDTDGKMSFVTPDSYVVLPCSELIWFHNKSLSMMLSDEHRVPVYDWRGKFCVKTAEALEKKLSRHRIPTTFVPPYADAPVSDEFIRLAVAINADAHHCKVGIRTVICVRKDRKKERLRWLLEANSIEFKEHKYRRPSELTFSFVSPYKEKTFSSQFWWELSSRQLGVVVEEMSNWDGLYEGADVRYYSSAKTDADFIQYAVHAVGGKATISTVQYPDKPKWRPTYVVHVAMPGSTKAVVSVRTDGTAVERVPTTDGRKYCFSVPTGFFVARHRGCVFVTGNSGKSVGCVIEVFRQAMQMPPCKDGIRRSRYAIVRNTRQQLKDTTLRTWLDWIVPGVFGKWKESEMIFEMRFADVQADIMFRPLDSAEDVQRVLSLELSGAWINEARETPVEILQALMSRVGRYPKREDVQDYRAFVIADTNPPEIDSAWYKILEHLPQEEGNLGSIMECDSFDQPSGLSPEAENVENLRKNYYDDLARGKTKAWVDTYIHGLYSPSQSGKPVYSTVFRPEKHVSRTPLKIDPDLPVIISFDCGLTPAATFKQMDLTGRVRVLREAAAFDMGMKRFSKNYLRPIIKNFFPNNPLIFIGDPAGKRRADSDESSAFKVLKEDYDEDGAIVKGASTNDPKVRIEATEQMLTQYPDGEPLMLIDPSCKWYIEALRSKYRYPKQKASGNFSDSPEKNEWSHIAEAGQYGDLYLLSGKYDPADHIRVEQNSHDPLNQFRAYRPAQREGY